MVVMGIFKSKVQAPFGAVGIGTGAVLSGIPEG